MLQALVAVVQEMRPKQWTKNALLFAGIVFSQHLNEAPRLLAAIIGFLVFCGLSGVIYIFNDLHDVESDRLHPLKCKRPIASGQLPVATAWSVGVIVAALSLTGAYALNTKFGTISLIYFLLMLLYSVVIKHLVILDLMVVAIGFVIRAIAGVLAIEKPGETIAVTPWFITCIMFLALFIVICKRRHELILLSDGARQHRPVLEHYSETFLDQMVSVATTSTVMSYALYAILGVPAQRSTYMVYTVPFVLFGILRYLYLVYKRDEGGAPENLLLQDWYLLVNVLLWLISMVLIFYAG